MSHTVVIEASLTGIARLIFILIVIYAVYSLIVRYILPALVKKTVRNFQEKFFEENPNLRKDADRGKEGEISIRRTDDVKARQMYNNAEETDYEEIK
ncbi:MAG TPA: hypothetical protein PK796_01095 [Bacteroidales bacterium]|nr:hypothetical protein [Bacteroidales bacterium]